MNTYNEKGTGLNLIDKT